MNKIINFIIKRSKIWRKEFKNFGINSNIYYPFIITGKESIDIGENTIILKNSRIQNYTAKNGLTNKIKIGNNCYIGYNFTILNASIVNIGDNVLIASNVMITSENHGMNPESNINYSEQPLITKPVEIDSGVWIGQNVCILPGTRIGKKSIIGANSVVTKDVPEYSIAVGSPAKVIKKYDFYKHDWIKVNE